MPVKTLSRRRLLENAFAGIAGGAALLAQAKRAFGAATLPVPDVASATILYGGLIAAIRATAPARIKVKAWPTRRPDLSVESAWHQTNGAYTAHIPLPTAGTAGTAWSWQGIVQDVLETATPVADVVRTVPLRPGRNSSSPFSFAFGCCLHTWPPAPTLGVAKSVNPLFFAMIGDMGYRDHLSTGQDYSGYLQMFRNFLAHPDLAPLLAVAPFYGMQDDHDYGADDCWADTVKEYAGRAFADLMPGVRWPDANYRRWWAGQADFFLLDNRRYRDNPDGPFENGRYMSVLRRTQRNWLLQGLANSTARVKFVLAPMTMAYYWWDGERRAVLDFIDANVSGTVVFLTGDRHGGAFFRHAPRVWEMVASPLKNDVKATMPLRPGLLWTENGEAPALSNCVGVVDVDAAITRTTTLRLLREDGSEMHREVVPLV